MDEHKYWLGFSVVHSVGYKRLQALLEHFGSLETAWTAKDSQLRAAGLGTKALENLLKARATLNLDAELAKIHQAGARLLTLADDDYPPSLKQTATPPVVLYVRGKLLPENQRALCIVGTRSATPAGREMAYQLAKELAAHGITIISGLAHGIDAAAHQGALDGGGQTIGVLGCGIDRMYPPENLALARAMLKQGAIISEFSLGTHAKGKHFPQRNRIMSGLSRGVLVIEAPHRSGALITASTALEQGRDVFAVPGAPNSPASAGCNRLIQDGAKLVLSAQDVLDEFGITYRAHPRRLAAAPVGDSPTETAILALLGDNPVHVDDLAQATGFAVALVNSTLTLLELKGKIRMVGGTHFVLVS